VKVKQTTKTHHRRAQTHAQQQCILKFLVHLVKPLRD